MLRSKSKLTKSGGLISSMISEACSASFMKIPGKEFMLVSYMAPELIVKNVLDSIVPINGVCWSK